MIEREAFELPLEWNTPNNPDNPTLVLLKLLEQEHFETEYKTAQVNGVPLAGHIRVVLARNTLHLFQDISNSPEYDALWRIKVGPKAMRTPNMNAIDETLRKQALQELGERREGRKVSNPINAAQIKSVLEPVVRRTLFPQQFPQQKAHQTTSQR